MIPFAPATRPICRVGELTDATPTSCSKSRTEGTRQVNLQIADFFSEWFSPIWRIRLRRWRGLIDGNGVRRAGAGNFAGCKSSYTITKANTSPPRARVALPVDFARLLLLTLNPRTLRRYAFLPPGISH
jgi:hypothetical protein